MAEEVWQLDTGGFTVYDRGYEQYAEARKAAQAGSGSPSSLYTREDAAGQEAAKPSLSREDQKRLKREQAELRNALYKEMKPVQDKYAALEKELETVLEKMGETEALLADPDVYADSGRATELLKDFHALQTRSETVMEDMAGLEAKLAEFEERRAAFGEEA